MLSRRAVICSLAVMIFSIAAVADVDSSSVRTSRSILSKPVIMTEADSAPISNATNFRPSVVGLENAINHVSDEHGAASDVLRSLNSWARPTRGDRPDFNVTAEVLRAERFVREQPPVTQVPEPASLALMASGLMSLGVLRRRK